MSYPLGAMCLVRKSTMGGFLSDAWDTVTSPFRAAGDWVTSLPGFSQASDALKDFANTAVGKVVLRAIATSITGPFAAVVGPQLASVAFAIPGLMRGEDFEHAWLDEFKWRVETTASILGADFAATFMDQFSAAMQELADNFNVGEQATWSLEELARRVAVREDVAAYALSLWNKVELPNRDAFDPETGKYLVFAEHINWVSELRASDMRVDTSALTTAKLAASGMNFAATNNLAMAPSPKRAAPVRGAAAKTSGVPTAALVAGGAAAVLAMGYFAFGKKKRR